MLEVISSDFVPITPYRTNSVLIGIGQRYAVVVHALPSTDPQPVEDGNYWIRTVLADQCGIITQKNPKTGIIRYNPKSTANPNSAGWKFPTACSDEPYDKLKPIVRWEVGHHPANNVTNNTYEAAIDTEIHHDFRRWDLTDYPLWLNFSNPTILNLKNTTWNNEYCIVDYNYDDQWVYLVVTGNSTHNSLNKTQIPAAHPIHLHGHDFAILAQENKTYDEVESPKTFKYANPPRRDVALLPKNGYLALAFKSDNPGIWLVHCHIAWHASSGLALQILERQWEIEGSIGPLDATKKTCKKWDVWLKKQGSAFDQNDSGI